MRRSLPLVPLLVVLAGEPAPAQVVPTGPVTLLQAITLGRSQGVEAAIAQLNVGAANARVGQRRAELLPTITGGAAYTRQTVNLEEFGFPGITGVTEPFDVYRVQLRASQTLFDASVIGRLRAARDTAVAAGLDAKAAGEVAGATAGLAYLRTLSAIETVRAREADSTIAATLLDQARQLVGAGVSPAIDQTRSEVSFAAVRTQLEVARNGADRSRLDLLRALDLPSGTRLELADSLGPGALDLPLDPDSAARFARDHRAELAAERARTQSARRSLGAIRAEYLPSVGLSGQYQQTGQHTGTLDGSYNVQLQLTVPILDGFHARELHIIPPTDQFNFRESGLSNPGSS